jgi:hypothetical protein
MKIELWGTSIIKQTILIFALTAGATACQELDSSSLNGYRATHPETSLSSVIFTKNP